MKEATKMSWPGAQQLAPENQTIAISRCGRLAVPEAFPVTDATRQDVAPEAMALRVTDLFGPSATTAAAWCALSAYCEADEEEYQFWFSVFRELTQRV
jgi:hypothetical protein